MSQIVQVAILACIGMALLIGLLAVLKMKEIKSELIRDRDEAIQAVLSAVGEVESLSMAQRRVVSISEVMKSHDVAALVLPLKSGGRVGFRLGPNGTRVVRV